MFHIVKEGESSPYGISYLLDVSKYHNRFVFHIVFPWFGDKLGLVRILIPKPFSEVKEGWNYSVVLLRFISTKPPVYESDTKD